MRFRPADSDRLLIALHRPMVGIAAGRTHRALPDRQVDECQKVHERQALADEQRLLARQSLQRQSVTSSKRSANGAVNSRESSTPI